MADLYKLTVVYKWVVIYKCLDPNLVFKECCWSIFKTPPKIYFGHFTHIWWCEVHSIQLCFALHFGGRDGSNSFYDVLGWLYVFSDLSGWFNVFLWCFRLVLCILWCSRPVLCVLWCFRMVLCVYDVLSWLYEFYDVPGWFNVFYDVSGWFSAGCGKCFTRLWTHSWRCHILTHGCW